MGGGAEAVGAAEGDGVGAPDAVGEGTDVGDAVGDAVSDGPGETAGLGLVVRVRTGWLAQPTSEATSQIKPTIWTRFIGHVPHVRMPQEYSAARALDGSLLREGQPT